MHDSGTCCTILLEAMKVYRYDSKSMQLVEINVWVYVMIVIGLFGLLSFSKSDADSGHYESDVKLIGYKTDDIPFSEANLKAYIKQCGIMHSDIVYAQMVLETGRFKSDVFLGGNNLMGMKVAVSRPTTAIGEYRGHAMYDHWTHAVQDYALYQSAYLRKLKNRDEYLSYLSDNYAEDPDYVNKLKRIIDGER